MRNKIDILDACIEDVLSDISSESVSVYDGIKEEIDFWLSGGTPLSVNPCILPNGFYKVQTANKYTLHDIVETVVRTYGNKCNLNWLDVSNVEYMSGLFSSIRIDFQGDISRWNVSSVKDMSEMFYGSHFNGDISRWDVSSVTNMENMFALAWFNRDISKWNIKNVEKMSFMFAAAQFNQDISRWNVREVDDLRYMFYANSEFNHDLSKWRIQATADREKMFEGCQLKKKFRPKVMRIRNLRIENGRLKSS